MTMGDHLLQQSVNQKLFEHYLQEFFTVAEPTATSEVVLGKDELNAIRYAAGFVPHILLKTWQSQVEIKDYSYRFFTTFVTFTGV